MSSGRFWYTVNRSPFKFVLLHLNLYFQMLSFFLECSAYSPIRIVALLSGLNVTWYGSAAERSSHSTTSPGLFPQKNGWGRGCGLTSEKGYIDRYHYTLVNNVVTLPRFWVIWYMELSKNKIKRIYALVFFFFITFFLFFKSLGHFAYMEDFEVKPVIKLEMFLLWTTKLILLTNKTCVINWVELR